MRVREKWRVFGPFLKSIIRKADISMIFFTEEKPYQEVTIFLLSYI
jgi:hypothetical protein